MASQPKLDPRDALAMLREKLVNGEPLSGSATSTAVKERPTTRTSRRPQAPTSATTTATPASMVRTRKSAAQANVSTPSRPTPSAVRNRPMTPAQSLVSGTVTYFNEEKGFGFAHAVVNGRHQQVFFHVNNARITAGTADAPQLTNDQHKDVYVTKQPPRPTEIVMIVKPASDPKKKATATTWGIRPKRNWRLDAIRLDKGYSDYAGGSISIVPNHGSSNTEEIRGHILEIKLTPTELTIVIADARHYDPSTGNTTTTDTLAICYKLKDAHLDAKNERTPERIHHKVIIAPSMHDKHQQVRIVLDKPVHRTPEA